MTRARAGARRLPRGIFAQPSDSTAASAEKQGLSQVVWVLLGAGILYAAYFVLRYGGLWTENDTTVFTRAGASTIANGSVLTAAQYVHGFGYPGWLSSIALLSGVNVSILNTIVAPFAGILLLTLSAYLVYRELLGSERQSLVAVLVLLATPDLLFSALRGNHEKLNITFMLIGIWVLLKSFKAMKGGNAGALTIWVLLFYLITFANATANDYFASTLVLASTLTLVAAWWLARSGASPLVERQVALRLIMTVLTSWVLVLWVMFYVFPPAGQDFGLLKTAFDKIAALFLSLQPSSNPYATATQQWSSPAVSLAVALSRYILLGGSFCAWCIEVVALLGGRRKPDLGHIFLVALYGGFGVIVAVNVAGDLTNLSFGTNLELRTFTYLALLAAPMLVSSVAQMLPTSGTAATRRSGQRSRAAGRPSPVRADRLLSAIFVAGILTFAVVGLPKVTLDPVVSNLWLFYTGAERQAMDFFEARPAPSHSRPTLWTGPDTRLANAAATYAPLRSASWVTHGVLPNGGPPSAWLQSPQILAYSRVQGVPLPSLAGQDRLYDNGGAQIYRPAPRTPFQS